MDDNTNAVENEITEIIKTTYKPIITISSILPVILIIAYKIGTLSFWNIDLRYIYVSFSELIVATVISVFVLLIMNRIHHLVMIKLLVIGSFCLSIALIVLLYRALNRPTLMGYTMASSERSMNFGEEIIKFLSDYPFSLTMLLITVVAFSLYIGVKSVSRQVLFYGIALVFVVCTTFFIGHETSEASEIYTVANNKYIVISEYGETFLCAEIYEPNLVTGFHCDEITYIRDTTVFIPISGSTVRYVSVDEAKFIYEAETNK